MKNKLLVIAFLFVVFDGYAQVNLSLGLNLYLPFNGNTLDASGNGNNATNNGAVLTFDQFGNANSAYLFDGVNDFMEIPNSSSLSPNSFSICVKVKPLSFYNGVCFNNVIFAKGTNCGNGYGDIGLSYTPSLNQNPATYCQIPDSIHENYRVYAGSNGAPNSLACINPGNAIPYIATNNWDCVVGTYDSTTGIANVFVNGLLRYSYTNINFLGVNASTIFLGKQDYPGYEYWMNAVLDEVRLYNRVINQAEIDSLCNIAPTVITPSLDILNNDTTICGSLPIQINTTTANISSFFWTPTVGLNNPNSLNPIAFPSTTTTYTLTGIANNSTTLIDSFTITINPLPTVNAGSNTSFCQGSSIALNGSATNAVSYQWIPAAGLSNANILNPTCNVNTTTTYSLIATSANACSDTDLVVVTVNPLPIVSAGTDKSFCNNTNGVILSGSGIGIPVWTISIGLSNTNTLNPTASPASATTYTLTVTSAQGCSSTDAVVVTPVIASLISASPAQTICSGDSCTLIANGASTYSWVPNTNLSINNNSAIAWPLSSTIFTITGTDANNCTSNTTVLVNVSAPLVTSINGPNIICIGDTANLNTTGSYSFTWLLDNTFISNNNNLASVIPTSTATYTVIATDANQCSTITSINIIVDTPPNLTVSKSNDIECNFNSAQLNANGAQNYAWSNNATLSNLNIANPIATPFTTTTYYVIGSNMACSSLDSINVLVYNNNANNIRMPNAFTPNGDGINDCFRVISNANFTNYLLRIYNRFGQLVFESTDPKKCWYGEQMGRENMDMGTYFYILKAKTECSEVTKKGDVTLIK